MVTTSAHFYVDSVGKKVDTVEHWQELEAAKLEKKLVDITKDQFGQ